MRFLTILVLVFSALSTIGQNYQPINSNSLQVFYQATTYNQQTGANIWGTRIDSIQIVGGDTLFYNYEICRDTISNFTWYNHCVWNGAPNWSGNFAKSNANESWFHTIYEDSVRIIHSGQNNETWCAFKFNNGDSLMASVESVNWIEDDWVSDSVKTIGFQRFTNGLPTPDPINSSKLELYKNHGLRKTVDFAKFPNDTVAIHRLDLNYINLNSPGFIVDNQRRPEPTIGDGYYHHLECGLGQCSSSNLTSSVVTDIQPNGVNGDLLVTVTNNSYEQSIGQMIIYPSNLQCNPWNITTTGPLSDQVVLQYEIQNTFSPLGRSWNGQYVMPRESGSEYRYELSYLADDSNCQYPTVTTYHGFAECSGNTTTYAPYIGIIAENYFYGDSWCGLTLSCQSLYSYLRIGDLSCGQQLMVGIDQTPEASFNLYPNPTSETVQIQLNHQEEVEVLVTDVLGRPKTLKQVQGDQAELDVSGWPNGVYLVSIVNKDGIRNTQRLLVQH